MSGTWAIDSLDARGGLAFASYRSFDLADEGDRLREAPCVWIAPPYFEPEPVVSRAVAWSAERGAFQLGLFHDGKEVRFQTLEAVTEFVRRTYLRSGGGDGLSGGGAPLPVPPPPDDRPDLRPPTLREGPDERSELDAVPRGSPRGGGGAQRAVDVLSFLTAFEAAAEAGAELVAGAPVQWIEKDDNGPSTIIARIQVGELRSGQDQLGWASYLLMHELLLRLPRASRPEEILIWQRSAHTLGEIITEFGAWDWLMSDPHRSELWVWADEAVRRWKRASLSPDFIGLYYGLPEPDRFFVFYSRMFSTSVWSFAWTRLRSPWRFESAYFWASTQSRRSSSDPVDDLSSLPLPSALARCVRQEKHDGVSVIQLLSATSGAPLSILNDGAQGRDAVAVLLFAAAWLLQSKEPLSWGAIRAEVDPLPGIEAARVSDLVSRAWAWLIQSMPRLAFSGEIESMIAGASALRYEGATNSDGTIPVP